MCFVEIKTLLFSWECSIREGELFSPRYFNATAHKRLQLFPFLSPFFLLSFKVFHLNENLVGVFVVSGGWVCTMVRAWDISQLDSNSVFPSSLLCSNWLLGETASGGSESWVGGARQCIKNQVSVPFTLQFLYCAWNVWTWSSEKSSSTHLFFSVLSMFFLFFFFSGEFSLKEGTSGLQALGDRMGQPSCVHAWKSRLGPSFADFSQLHSLWWVTLQADVECNLWRPPSTSLHLVRSAGKSKDKRQEVTQKRASNNSRSRSLESSGTSGGKET